MASVEGKGRGECWNVRGEITGWKRCMASVHTMSVDVETEDVRLTVHVDIRKVSACIFNMCMHFKMSFAKNRAQHARRILPNAASHVRTQVQTKETLL